MADGNGPFTCSAEPPQSAELRAKLRICDRLWLRLIVWSRVEFCSESFSEAASWSLQMAPLAFLSLAESPGISHVSQIISSELPFKPY